MYCTINAIHLRVLFWPQFGQEKIHRIDRLCATLVLVGLLWSRNRKLVANNELSLGHVAVFGHSIHSVYKRLILYRGLMETVGDMQLDLLVR